MKIFLALFFYSFVLVSMPYALSQDIDSLVSTTEKLDPEVAKIKTLFELSQIHKYDSTDAAEKYAHDALLISEKIVLLGTATAFQEFEKSSSRVASDFKR